MAADAAAWGGPPERGSGAGTGKRQRAGESEDASAVARSAKGMSPEQSELLASAAKGVMQLMTDVKNLKATVFRSFMFEAETPLARSAKEQLKEYRTKVHGNPGHSLGPPDVWLWRGIVLCCTEELAKMGEHTKEAHRLFLAHHSACVPGELGRLVFHCKLSDCYKKPDKPARVRLEVGTHDSMEPLVNALRGYVLAIGGEELSGKQPRGAIERDIQRLLVKTKVWKDRPPSGGMED